jgi:hypothetical protein
VCSTDLYRPPPPTTPRAHPKLILIVFSTNIPSSLSPFHETRITHLYMCRPCTSACVCFSLSPHLFLVSLRPILTPSRPFFLLPLRLRFIYTIIYSSIPVIGLIVISQNMSPPSRL